MASPLRQWPAPASPSTPGTVSTAPQPSAPARWLRLPQVEQRLRYRWHLAMLSWPTLLAGHRLRPAPAVAWACRFEPPADLGERLAALFDLRQGPSAPAYPLVPAQAAIELLQRRLLTGLGLRPRQVRLLRQRMRWPAGVPAGLATRTQDVDCRLLRVVRVGPTDVAVLTETTVADVFGQTIVQLDDIVLAHRLPAEDAARADADDLLRRTVSRLRRRERLIDADGDGVHQRQLFVPPDAVPRHARLAGIGWGRPSSRALPAAYLRQLVAREWAEWGLDPSVLHLSFVAAAAPGQTLRLLQQGAAFELLDAQGRLVAFGGI
jgi:hypothetical protein